MLLKCPWWYLLHGLALIIVTVYVSVYVVLPTRMESVTGRSDEVLIDELMSLVSQLQSEVAELKLNFSSCGDVSTSSRPPCDLKKPAAFVAVVAPRPYKANSGTCVYFPNSMACGFGCRLSWIMWQARVQDYGYTWVPHPHSGSSFESTAGLDQSGDKHMKTNSSNGMRDVFSRYNPKCNLTIPYNSEQIPSDLREFMTNTQSFHSGWGRTPGQKTTLGMPPVNLFASLSAVLKQMADHVSPELAKRLAYHTNEARCVGVHMRMALNAGNDYRKRNEINPVPFPIDYYADLAIHVARTTNLTFIRVMTEYAHNGIKFAELVKSSTNASIRVEVLDRPLATSEMRDFEILFLHIKMLASCNVVIGSMSSWLMQIAQLWRPGPYYNFLDTHGFMWSGYVKNQLIKVRTLS